MEEKALILDIEGLYKTTLYFTRLEKIGEIGINLWYNDKLILDSMLDGYKMVRDYTYNNIECYRLEREVI